MLWINFKTYGQASGVAAVRLAQVCDQVATKTGVSIVPIVQATDLYRVASQVGGAVWAQHLDPIEPGRQTGWLGPEAIKLAGGTGTLLNHSEHKLESDQVLVGVEFLKAKGFPVAVCCSSLEEGEVFFQAKPDYLVFEPPELIGSRETSVAKAKPNLVAEFVKRFGQVPILIGAGVQDEEDIKVGRELGAKGFLIASAVVKAEDQALILTKLAKACL